MRNAMSVQLAGEYEGSLRQQRRLVTIALWVVQVLLALIFLFAGSMKLILPLEVMTAQMALPLPGLLLRFIGVAEVAGALGLILPCLLRIRPMLTPLAACGLIIIMIGAVTITVVSMGVGPALFPLVVGLLAASVVYGRRSYFRVV